MSSAASLRAVFVPLLSLFAAGLAVAAEVPLKWKTINSSIHFSKADGFLSAHNANRFLALSPVPAGDSRLTIKADLRNVSVGEKGGWVAIGIGAPKQDPANILWSGGFFALLNARGEYECLTTAPGDGVRPVTIKRGRVPRFDAEKPTRFELTYDRAASTLSLLVNGVAVVESYESANLPYEVTPSFAGLSGYAQKPGEPVVLDFSLESNP